MTLGREIHPSDAGYSHPLPLFAAGIPQKLSETDLLFQALNELEPSKHIVVLIYFHAFSSDAFALASRLSSSQAGDGSETCCRGKNFPCCQRSKHSGFGQEKTKTCLARCTTRGHCISLK